MKRRVVITGVGPVTCCGIGKEALWASLHASRSGIGRLTTCDAGETQAINAGEIRDWDGSAFFPPHRLKRLDRYVQFAVASARLALEDSGLAWSPDRLQPSVGVCFGTGLGGIAHAEYEHARFLKKGSRAVDPTIAVKIFGGSAHSQIAIECGFQGPANTYSNTCASGVIAVGEALRYLRDGMADVMIAGGAEAPLCPLTFNAFDFIKTMSRYRGEPAAQACRPFDLERDGFVMGEGAASLVLETLEHAEARGARIYAEVRGYSMNNEAFHMTTPRPGGERLAAVMRGALRDGGLTPGEIDYVNAHASSTQANDSNETAAIREVFAGAKLPSVSGTKPFHAHPLGATGAIETIISTLALAEGWLPPTLHLQNPDPACGDFDFVPHQGRPAPLRAALCNAFGFGGANASIALSRYV